ncbi:ATP-binding cassette domain-containing protein, partial [Pseudomonas aeruginosa]
MPRPVQIPGQEVRKALERGLRREPRARLPRLELRGISKRYPGCLANDRIDLCIDAGEIHALLGENVAGNSTLMKIIYGVTRPDAGEVRWQAEPGQGRDP